MASSDEDRAERLRLANIERSNRKKVAVTAAVAEAGRLGQRISIQGVAKRANVSRNFIYQNPDLRQLVQQADASRTEPGRTPTSSSDASLRSRLRTALDALAAEREKNRELSRRIETLTHQLTQLMASEGASQHPNPADGQKVRRLPT